MQRIAAKAVKLLLTNGVNSFPINPKTLVIPDFQEILYLDYTQGEQIIENNNLQEAARTNNGMAIRVENEYCVLWNGELGIAEEAEIIGHEFAHIALRHGIYNTIIGGQKTVLQEIQAEAFKRELLAPTIILAMMNINSVEQIQAITGVSEKTAQSVYLEIGKRKQLKEPFLSDDEKVLWEAFKEKLPKNSPALTIEDPKEQSLQRSAQSIAIDFKKYLKFFKGLVSVIGICVILLVLLDSKFQFIQKGDYIEPQNRQASPLTPDYPNNYTVYVTAHGEKYHRATCHYLTDSKRSIDIYDAIAEGYEPCSICKP